MRKFALSLSLLLACSLIASDLERRTADLVAMFNKTKHVSKNKRGVSKSMFLQVKSDPVVRKDPSTYSGVYLEPGFRFSIDLSVRRDGSLTGNGSDERGSYTLHDGRVRGALLTATKAYPNGATSPLEGVFLQRVVREGTAPDKVTSRTTAFGVGVRTPGLEADGGIHIEKLFFEAR
ncbi:MAG TPA: hypothetical protein VEK57_17425 [Thermoanaerobaculia bacterium]|nr:hypothetical protein [Thermoanaerobaculia bacterium]